jgi:O-antigen ligase
VISVICWAAVPVVHMRISALENWQQDVSVRVRLKIWQESAKIWRSAPIVGIGIRHFPHFDFPEAIVPGHSKDLNHAHSNYLHILATTGMFGLITYLWLWLVVLTTAVRTYKQCAGQSDDPTSSSLALGVFGATVALMVAGIFEYNFGTAQVRLAQWFVLAMLHGKEEEEEHELAT